MAKKTKAKKTRSKATVEVSGELHKKLKKAAKKSGTSIKALVEELLTPALT